MEHMSWEDASAERLEELAVEVERRVDLGLGCYADVRAGVLADVVSGDVPYNPDNV